MCKIEYEELMNSSNVRGGRKRERGRRNKELGCVPAR
jgi:hypothetical protein